MKKLVYLFVSLFLVVVAAENLNAQTSDTETVTASAKIVQPIDLSLTNGGLNFGTLVPSGTDGTVTVPPSGARTSSDVGFIDQQDLFTPATFKVEGEVGTFFTLDLPTGDAETPAINLTDADGNTMPVYNFTSTFGENTSGVEIVSNGTLFAVGATIGVDSDQDAGNYTGSFNVTVAYD